MDDPIQSDPILETNQGLNQPQGGTTSSWPQTETQSDQTPPPQTDTQTSHQGFNNPEGSNPDPGTLGTQGVNTQANDLNQSDPPENPTSTDPGQILQPNPPTTEVVNQGGSGKSNKFLIIVVILLALLIFGTDAFFFYQNMQLKKQVESIQSQPATTPVPFPTATPDPTLSWKTYTDKNGKFTFKYPNQERIKVTETENSVQLGVPETEGWVFTVSWFQNTDVLARYTVDKSIYKYTDPLEPTTINGYEAMKTVVPPGMVEVTYYYFQRGKDVYRVDVNTTSVDEPIILSTFKFLEASPSPTSSPTPSTTP